MIASDGMMITGAKVHPRAEGTFSRVLGHYVREEKTLDLMTALRKMTWMPRSGSKARTFVQDKRPASLGADADITVFDATAYATRLRMTHHCNIRGIQFVLVNGVPVVKVGNSLRVYFRPRRSRTDFSVTTPRPKKQQRATP